MTPAAEAVRDAGWKVFHCVLKDKGLVAHQTESFDRFCDSYVPTIIAEFPDVEASEGEGPDRRVLTYVIHSPRLSRPVVNDPNGAPTPLLPNEARLRNLTYAGRLEVDVTRTWRDGSAPPEVQEIENWHLGDVPVMVGSHLCNTRDHVTQNPTVLRECQIDGGGYFIVSGAEKVVLAQERLATNSVYVFESRGQIVAECRSTQNVALRGGNIIVASTPKVPQPAILSSQLSVSLPQMRSDLPLATVMVALGLPDAPAMVAACTHGRLAAAGTDLLAFEGRRADFSPEGRARAEASIRTAWSRGEEMDVREYLMREVVPHVPSLEQKARFLGYMVWRMLAVRDGVLDPDDRDDYVNKRVDLAGVLMAQLFRQLYKRVRANLRSQLTKCLERHTSQGARAVNARSIQPDREPISKGFRFSLATGTWGVQGTPSARQCVSQVLNRLNLYSTLSHLRRINSPAGREGKLTQPRQIHNTQWGLVCFAETPEGQPIGLVKNMAVLAHVTVGFDADVVIEALAGHLGTMGRPVIVNGTHVGHAPETVVEHLRGLRRRGALSWEMSCVYVPQDEAIHIHTDGGRLCRPLMVVAPDGTVPAVAACAGGRPQLDALLAGGVLDYLDVLESTGALVAMTGDKILPGKTTHCEPHPSSTLGVCASLIPFPDHDQSPRVTYQVSPSLSRSLSLSIALLLWP